MKNIKNKGFNTKLIHANSFQDLSGAVNTPIYMSSTFDLNVSDKYIYTRHNNPTIESLETQMAILENAKFALAFSSGIASINAAVNLVKPEEHILVSKYLYGGTFKYFFNLAKQNNRDFNFVDITDINQLNKFYKKNTKMLIFESPSNPLLKVIDIEKIVNWAKQRDIITVFDNTFASSYLQNPLNFSIDIVVHSATKYISGHSDVIGGILIVNNENFYEKLHSIRTQMGTIISPFDSYLLIRGLKTLAVRMKYQSECAYEIAKFLKKHKEVKEVYYPAFADNIDIVKKQMSSFGAMLSFKVESYKKAKNIVENVEIFTHAASLGGVESLIVIPYDTIYSNISDEYKLDMQITPDIIRLSIGLEDCKDLIEELNKLLLKD